VRPLGFVANEYALAVWGLGDMSSMIKQATARSRRAVRSGYAGRRSRSLARGIRADEAHLPDLRDHFRPDRPGAFTGEEKTRRQVLFSTDLIYDVLRKHQPDHVLLRAARADAATGLLDLRRLGDMPVTNQRVGWSQGLDRVSPLAVPVMLEIGREQVYGEASDELLAAEARMKLVKEAMS